MPIGSIRPAPNRDRSTMPGTCDSQSDREKPCTWRTRRRLQVQGSGRRNDEQRDTLLDPTLLIEVLSPPTEAYDRGEKFEHYRKLESLREYILIAQERLHVEQFIRRSDGQWLLSEWSASDSTVPLASLGATLALAEVYDKVEL